MRETRVPQKQRQKRERKKKPKQVGEKIFKAKAGSRAAPTARGHTPCHNVYATLEAVGEGAQSASTSQNLRLHDDVSFS
jgi:hypothetical protein